VRFLPKIAVHTRFNPPALLISTEIITSSEILLAGDRRQLATVGTHAGAGAHTDPGTEDSAP